MATKYFYKEKKQAANTTCFSSGACVSKTAMSFADCEMIASTATYDSELMCPEMFEPALAKEINVTVHTIGRRTEDICQNTIS